MFKFHIAILLIFATIQIGESLLRANTWPFSSFSMYSENLIKANEVVMVRFKRNNEVVEIDSPWNLLKVDYYKSLILMNRLMDPNDPLSRHLPYFSEVMREVSGTHADQLEIFSINLTSVQYPLNIYSQQLPSTVLYAHSFNIKN